MKGLLKKIFILIQWVKSDIVTLCHLSDDFVGKMADILTGVNQNIANLLFFALLFYVPQNSRFAYPFYSEKINDRSTQKTTILIIL